MSIPISAPKHSRIVPTICRVSRRAAGAAAVYAPRALLVRHFAARSLRLCALPFHQLVERHAEQLRETQELIQLRNAGIRLPLAHRLAADLQRVGEVALR